METSTSEDVRLALAFQYRGQEGQLGPPIHKHGELFFSNKPPADYYKERVACSGIDGDPCEPATRKTSLDVYGARSFKCEAKIASVSAREGRGDVSSGVRSAR